MIKSKCLYRLSIQTSSTVHVRAANAPASQSLQRTSSVRVIGHRMATVERSILVVTEERAVVDVNTLHNFQTTHFLEWHVKLFGLGKEVRAWRENMLQVWRRQWRSLPLRSRMRSSMILHVVSYSNTRGGSSRD